MNEREIKAGFEEMTKGLSPIGARFTTSERELMLAAFRLGVVWTENAFFHEMEDQNSLQFPEQAE